MPERKGPPPDPDDLFFVPEGDEDPEPDPGPEPEPSPLDELVEEPALDEALSPDEDEDLLPPDGEDALGEEDQWWAPEAAEGPLLPEPTDEIADEFSPVHDEGEDIDWGALEDESRATPSGALRVGWREAVSLLGCSDPGVTALCDPCQAGSTLSATVESAGPGQVRVQLRDASWLASGTAEAPARCSIAIALGGHILTLDVALAPPGQDPPLRLGRDALAGRFLVDPSRDGCP